MCLTMLDFTSPASPIEIKRIHQLFLESLNQDRICYTPHCPYTAINSHVVQKKRVLSQIASNGKFRELRWPDGTLPHRFSSAGINKTDVLSFPGFCGNEGNDCDRKIFSPIEPTKPNETIDFLSYSNQILFSYRATICELHKMDSWISTYHKIISDNTFSKPTRRYYKQHALPEFKKNRRSTLYLKRILESEMKQPSVPNRFTFHVASLPFIEVVGSGVFGAATSLEFIDSKKSTGAAFIHAIPENNFTTLIIGYDNGVKEIEGIPIKSLDKALSDKKMLATVIFTIFIKRIETWGISEKFYQELHATGLDEEILQLIEFYLPVARKSQPFFFDVLGLLEDRKKALLNTDGQDARESFISLVRNEPH